MQPLTSHLLMFTGTECKHCHKMDPLVERLEEATGLKVQKLECWHNAENDAFRDSVDGGFCGGVPFFYNTKTKKKICGETDFESLAEWASGK